MPNPTTQEVFFPVSVFDKLAVNMTSCSMVKEETDEEEDRQENSTIEIDKTLVATTMPKLGANF